MRKLFLLLLTSALLPVSLSAQKAINAGIKSYEAGKYEAAIASLDEGLENADNMKDKDLAEAYFYRASAKATYLHKLKSFENLPEEMDLTVYEYGLTAAEDVSNAIDHDKDKKWAKQLPNLKISSQNILVDMCRIDLLEGQKKDATDEDKKFHFERVIKMANAGINLDKFNYVNYNLKAEAQLGLGKKSDALTNFNHAASYFYRSAPRSGDLRIGYTFMHIAELEKELNNDMKAAKAAIDTGLEKLKGESMKIESLGNRRPAEKAQLKDLFEEIKKEMEKVGAGL